MTCLSAAVHEDEDFTSTVSTAGEAGTGTDLEGGHGVTADSLDYTGRIEPYSDKEDFDGKIVLHPRLHRGDLDDDSGINNGTCGLEDELEDSLDREDDDEDSLKGERQQYAGEKPTGDVQICVDFTELNKLVEQEVQPLPVRTRGGGARGGRETRGGSLVENPQFHDEDFPDLHSKPSENTATMQLNRAEVKSSAKPAGFKGSDLTGSNSSQEEKWDNTVKGSGMTHWGWGKRPSLPPRAVPDAPPKQQDSNVKEDVPLGHRVSSPAPQSPMMTVEAPQVST
ncbi:hypothetical protein MRX96_005287 [Rhipicephalus microplus]